MLQEFVEAALSDRGKAEAMLAAHPELAAADFYTALVSGNAGMVSDALDNDADLIGARGGPCQWPPLLYVCFSRLAGRGSARADSMAETAQALLDNGADPNANYEDPRWPGNPLSALYGATGLNDNPELAKVLLDAGADPDDHESLYHSTEHANLECLKLLLDHGANPQKPNALQHMLDREELEGLQLLLDAGADPDETGPDGSTALHWAVLRVRSAAAIEMLSGAGADLDARRHDGRTAYAMAAISGQTEVAALLESLGADTGLSPLDRQIVARSAAIPDTAETRMLLVEFASSHRTNAVAALLAGGVPVNSTDSQGYTALHWACWKGYADLVKLLLDHGASLTIEEPTYHATPVGWYEHGKENCREGGGDYAEVGRLLGV